jgi:hypothetical protein
MYPPEISSATFLSPSALLAWKVCVFSLLFFFTKNVEPEFITHYRKYAFFPATKKIMYRNKIHIEFAEVFICWIYLYN